MWEDVLLYVIIGFIAQMIDGAIGMAYGVTASSVLLGLGVPPATASACVHAAEPSMLAVQYKRVREPNVEAGSGVMDLTPVPPASKCRCLPKLLRCAEGRPCSGSSTPRWL